MTTANTSDNNLFLIFFISFFLSGLFQTFGLWPMILHLQSLVTFRYNSCAPLPYLYPHRKDISPACFHIKYIPLTQPSQASCTQYQFATPMPAAANIWEKKAGKTPIPFHLWYLSFACMSLSVFDVMHLRPKLADCTAAFRTVWESHPFAMAFADYEYTRLTFLCQSVFIDMPFWYI